MRNFDPPSPPIVLPASIASGPIVYGWLRGREYLYIGMSIYGIGRLARTHHIFGARAVIEERDLLHIWPCEYKTQAYQLELKLIEKYSPRFNNRLLDKEVRAIRKLRSQ